MSFESLFADPPMSIPFTLHGLPGRLAVHYGVSHDPIAAGFGAIDDLGFDPQLCRGYPLLIARIEEFARGGYESICGWIQMITRRDSYDRDPAAAHEKLSSSIDTFPAFESAGLPFAGFGSLPQFCDAPCRNLNDSARLHWTADTFLVSVPLRSRNEPIERLAGVRWGYVETDDPTEEPTVLPLELTGPAAWNDHLPYLRRTFVEWRFATA